MNRFLNQFRNEDWIATLIGALLVVLVILTPNYIPVVPKTLASGDAWLNLGGLFLLIGLLAAVGLKALGENIKGFIPSFLAIFALAIFSQWIAEIAAIKYIGLESVFFSVAIGLIIRNIFGLPKWLAPAVRSEYFIKAGLVLLGTSVLFGNIMKEGALGMVQAIVVVFTVWYFSFWLAKKLKVDAEMGIMMASAVSICGVSAAIATNGAIKGDPKKLSFVVSIVLVVAIPMMYLMPWLANLMGLSPEVAGAWMGGTIDTTGAVVAAGKFLGETGETYSVIIKSAQNVLLGVAAFAISIYWSYKGTNKTSGTRQHPTLGVLWERFPKFVIGFLLASLVFSTAFGPAEAKVLGSTAKGLREMLFSLAFVCIGLETDFRTIFTKENKKYITTFMVAQAFNVLVTLLMAYLLFGVLRS